VIEDKIEAYGLEGIKIKFNPNPFTLCILTPIMQRAHELPLASEIVFMDSTSCCDSKNHSITFLMTPCAAGAAPLAVFLTAGQTSEDYTSGLKLLKSIMGDTAFGGKGNPKIIITDDSDAKKNAIDEIWGDTKSLLCLFHLPQVAYYIIQDLSKLIKKLKNLFFCFFCRPCGDGCGTTSTTLRTKTDECLCKSFN